MNTFLHLHIVVPWPVHVTEFYGVYIWHSIFDLIKLHPTVKGWKQRWSNWSNNAQWNSYNVYPLEKPFFFQLKFLRKVVKIITCPTIVNHLSKFDVLWPFTKKLFFIVGIKSSVKKKCKVGFRSSPAINNLNLISS